VNAGFNTGKEKAQLSQGEGLMAYRKRTAKVGHQRPDSEQKNLDFIGLHEEHSKKDS